MLALGMVYKGNTKPTATNPYREANLPMATQYLQRCLDLKDRELKLAVKEHNLNHWNFFQVPVAVDADSICATCSLPFPA
jgi:hypothetical protein